VRPDHGMSGSLGDAQLAAALKKRSKRFAIHVIWLSREFPRSVDALIVAKQLIRASTSTAANYRAACRTIATTCGGPPQAPIMLAMLAILAMLALRGRQTNPLAANVLVP
jgi:hypothetical protein